jgi:hypothetical protein
LKVRRSEIVNYGKFEPRRDMPPPSMLFQVAAAPYIPTYL